MKYLICSKDKQKNLVEKFIFLIFTIFLISISPNLNGQNKPLDNGDLEVVNKKDLQSETYFDFTKKGGFNSNGVSTLLRYGINKNFELQVTWNGNRYETGLGHYSVSSSRVGIKAFLIDDSKYLPGISLIGSVNLTIDPSLNPLTPSINVLFRKGLVNNFTLTGNVNFILDEQNSQLSNEYAANLDVEMTSWLTTYVGIKGTKSYTSPISERAFYEEFVEVGMLFWISDGFRIYPFYDFGLRDFSNDIINIGVIYNFK